MDDLRAVADAAGIGKSDLDRAVEGGPLALLFAAAYPERVRSLVLWGTMARMLGGARLSRRPADSIHVTNRSSRSGAGVGTRIGAPVLRRPPRDDATPTGHPARTSARARRRKARSTCCVTTPRSTCGACSTRSTSRHSWCTGRRIRCVLPSLGRYVAEHIEGARYVELPGRWHVSGWVGRDDDCSMSLRSSSPAPATGSPTSIGPRDRAVHRHRRLDGSRGPGRPAWRVVLEQHDEITRREVSDTGASSSSAPATASSPRSTAPARGARRACVTAPSPRSACNCG